LAFVTTATRSLARGHNRVCKRLFLLEGAEEDEVNDPDPSEADAVGPAPRTSLHAIAGVHRNDTMRIHLKLGNTSLVALLDSRSTHNFTSEAADDVCLSPPVKWADGSGEQGHRYVPSLPHR